MKLNRLFAAAVALAGAVSCGPAAMVSSMPDSKVAIVAHRGYWDCDEGGHAQNSVAALKAAQDAGFWGSEFDVQLTLDGIVVSNHDKEYGPEKMVIAEHTYAELLKYTLPNGEKLPTLEEYLAQGAKCSTTMLVLEVKPQKTDSLTAELVDRTMEIVRKMDLYDPSRICFISFSKFACDRLVEKHPQFDVEFLAFNPLTSLSSSENAECGYYGADYNVVLFKLQPRLIRNLHKKGLKANVWTIDKPKTIKDLISKGIDQVTTNNPMAAREILGEKEYKL